MQERHADLTESRIRVNSPRRKNSEKSEEIPENNCHLRKVDNDGSLPNFERNFRKAEYSNQQSPRGRAAAKVTASRQDMVDLLEDWIADAEYEGQSKMTIRGKRSAIELFLWWLKREKIDDVGQAQVKAYLTYLANAHESPFGRFDEAYYCSLRSKAPGRPKKAGPILPRPSAFKPLSERTIQLYFVYIKGFFSFLASEEIEAIPYSPLENIKQPKATSREVKPFTLEEVSDLLRAALRGESPLRDVALIYFLLDTGAREDEVATLHLRDLHRKSGSAHVIGKGNRERDICFEGDTRRHLNKYLKKFPCDPDKTVFRAEKGITPGEGLTGNGIYQIIRRLGKRAGITEKRCSPHTFRHTFASLFLKQSGTAKALQMLLGHRDMQMTMRYVHLNDADTKDQHRRASPARALRGCNR